MSPEISPNIEKSPSNSSFKKITILLSVLIVFLGIIISILTFKTMDTKGDYVLIVNVASEDEKKELSEVEYIKKALKYGGHISVNVDIARKVEEGKFDELYTILNKDNKFVILPAILNWVGGHGWKLNQGSLLGVWIFTKQRGIFDKVNNN